MESIVFAGGGTPKRHPVTGMCLQDGIGCAPDDSQAMNWHLPLIAKEQGPAAAAAMKKKLTDYIAAKTAKKAEAAAVAKVVEDGVTPPA
jgi:hypothetical protein